MKPLSELTRPEILALAGPELAAYEEWRPVPEFEGVFEISESGALRRLAKSSNSASGFVTRGHRHKGTGYFYITLRHCGRIKKATAHSVVAAVFLGPRPPDMVVNHLDGNKTNNHWRNLEYTTRAGNNIHAHQMGLAKKPPINRQCKLTDSQVVEILNLKGQASQWDIARRFGVSQGTVSNIHLGKSRAALLATWTAAREEE